MDKVNSRKQLTLDFNATCQSAAKKARVQQVQQNFILTSPDLQMLNLTSPQVKEFLTRNPTLATPTPGFEFPKSVTEQQELYVKGFEEALEDIKAKEQHQHKNDEGHYLNHHHPIFHHEHQTLLTSPSDAILTIEKATAAYNRLKHVQQKSQANTQQPVATLPPPPPPLILAPFSSVGDMSRPSSGASGSLDSSIESHYLNSNITVKEETDDSDFSSGQPSSRSRSRRKRSTSSSNDLVSPINLESQERIKLDRKRQRNRLAATKCRQRKLERIAQLDEKVNDLKGENSDLAVIVKNLKEAVCKLKQEVLDHVNTGCQINVADELSLYGH